VEQVFGRNAPRTSPRFWKRRPRLRRAASQIAQGWLGLRHFFDPEVEPVEFSRQRQESDEIGPDDPRRGAITVGCPCCRRPIDLVFLERKSREDWPYYVRVAAGADEEWSIWHWVMYRPGHRVPGVQARIMAVLRRIVARTERVFLADQARDPQMTPIGQHHGRRRPSRITNLYRTMPGEIALFRSSRIETP